MGANLSIVNDVDKSGIVLAANDLRALHILLTVWLGTLYVCAMIFSTCFLIDRWKGPHDKIRQGAGSVLVAFVLSTAWPVVMAYMALNR
jgi:hypothetical protein